MTDALALQRQRTRRACTRAALLDPTTRDQVLAFRVVDISSRAFARALNRASKDHYQASTSWVRGSFDRA